jgi:hypothetical protein
MILITRAHRYTDKSEALVEITEQPYSAWLDQQRQKWADKRRDTPVAPPSRGAIARRHNRYILDSLLEALEAFGSTDDLDEWIVAGHLCDAPLGAWIDHYGPFALRAGLTPDQARELYEEHTYAQSPSLEDVHDAFRKTAKLTPAQVRAYSSGSASIAEL